MNHEFWTERHDEMMRLHDLARRDASETGQAGDSQAEAANRRAAVKDNWDVVKRDAYETAVSLSALYKRNGFLRKALEDDGSTKPLVDRVNKGRDNWRLSMVYGKNIERVREWREHNCRPRGHESVHGDIITHIEGFIMASRPTAAAQGPDTSIGGDAEKYSVERDIQARVVQYKSSATPATSSAPSRVEYKPVEDGPHEKFKGQFPSHKAPVSFFLYPHETSRPPYVLSKQNSADKLRYFHIPSNNMEVSD
jgi:hypothetical protein